MDLQRSNVQVCSWFWERILSLVVADVSLYVSFLHVAFALPKLLCIYPNLLSSWKLMYFFRCFLVVMVRWMNVALSFCCLYWAGYHLLADAIDFFLAVRVLNWPLVRWLTFFLLLMLKTAISSGWKIVRPFPDDLIICGGKPLGSTGKAGFALTE